MLKEKITENKSFDERLKESTNIKKNIHQDFLLLLKDTINAKILMILIKKNI